VNQTVTRVGLLDMMQAVRRAGVLRAGMKLNIFDGLADGPADPETLAAWADLPARGVRVLLNALAAIGVLEAEGGRFSLADGASDLLVTASPGYFGHAMKLAGSDYEWEALASLAEAVRADGTVLEVNAETPDFGYWEDFAVSPTGNTEPMAELMAEVLLKWSGARPALDVLDVACGHGMYGYALAARDPRVRVWDVDWPNVLDVAEEHARRLGVANRVNRIPGDMFTVPLGGPYDITVITNVLHHFSRAKATEMIRRLGEVTKPDGRLAVVTISADARRPADNPIPHLFSALMLTWTREGEAHPISDYAQMLAEGGFTVPDLYELPGIPLTLLVADRCAR
jgi:2-polyprenyl-3-methyl-5-hydroxy-6-metoxy-1,4-benzoquinol methylase